MSKLFYRQFYKHNQYIRNNHDNHNKKQLFSGAIIKWKLLTIAEKVVSSNIILIPVWWILGLYRYMALFILIGAFFYEYRYRGGIQLKKPTLSVLFLLIFSSYNLIGLNFYRLATTGNLEVTADLRFLTFWYGLTFLLWYIQSYKIKVRLPVVAWSVSILVVEMLAFWIIGELIFGSRDYTPVRTIFSIFAGNADGGYEPGKGLANYLIPYRPNDVSIAQFSRWSFFFIIPEVLALVTGYIILLALDIRNSFWSGLLMSSSFFLLLISGTRSVWLVVPILIFLRFIFNKGFQQGLTALLAVIALTSWITLSFPVVTESLFEAYESQIVNVENYRADSTEVRNDIYQETLKAIPEKPIFGQIGRTSCRERV